MARRRNEDAMEELVCVGLCANDEDEDAPTWMVSGRFNADGEFEPFGEEDADCPECGERGEPTGVDTVLADF